MIWQNPWALLGVAALALPVLIHLLGRGRARVLRFPSLRFLAGSRLLPTRRTRLHDPLLLAVRLGILAAAVAALAQPLWLSAGRARTRNGALARVVIVDTSISMQRSAVTGGRALDAARRSATMLADSASPSMIVESATPGAMVAGAVAWLARQPARSEIAIVSDFQPGAVSETELRMIPQSTGVRVVRIAVAPGPDTVQARMRTGDADVVARSTFTSSATTTEWSAATRSATDNVVQLLAGESERAAASAAERAALANGIPLAVDSARRVAIVYPAYPERAALLKAAAAPRTRWMTDLVLRLRIESPVSIATVAQDSGAAGARLLLFSAADAGSLASATLIAAVTRALATAPSVAELEPASLPDSVLARWQRTPSAEAPRRTVAAGEGESDGRWLWIVVVALMILESVIRRPGAPSVDITTDRVLHDRVA